MAYCFENKYYRVLLYKLNPEKHQHNIIIIIEEFNITKIINIGPPYYSIRMSDK